MTKASRNVILLFLSALVVRFIFLLEFKSSIFFDAPVGPDVSEYLLWAKQILSGNPWFEAHMHAPVYPFSLAVLVWLSSFNFFFIRSFQLLLGLGSLFLIFLTVKRLFGEKTALCTSILWILYTPLLFYEASILCEGTLVFFVSLSLFLVTELFSKKSLPSLTSHNLILSGFTGFSAALAALTHPFALVIGLSIILYILLLCIKDKKKYLLLIPFVFLYILPLLFVSLANSSAEGKPIFIQKNSGMNLYLGNNPDANGTPYLRPGKEYDNFKSQKYITDKKGEIQEKKGYFLGKTLSYISCNPLEWSGLFAKKIFLVWTASDITSTIDLPTIKNDSFLIKYCPLPFWLISGLAFAGILSLFTNYSKRKHLLFLAVLISYTLIMSISVVSDRYRLGMMPIMFIFAGIGLAHILEKRTIKDIFVLSTRKTILIIFFAFCFALNQYIFTFPLTHEKAEIASLKGEASLKKNNLLNAAIFFTKAISFHPGNIQNAERLGSTMMEMKKYNSAEKLFNEILAKNPNSYISLLNLGIIASEKGEMNKAEDFIESSLKKNPKYPEALYNLGLIKEKQNNINKAKAFYLQTIKLKPDFVSALINTGTIYQRQGQYKEAEKYYKKVIRINPEKTNALTNLACCSAAQNKPKLAEKYFEKSLKIDPQQSKVWQIFAQYAKKNLSPEKYKEILQQIKILFPRTEKSVQKLQLYLFSSSTCDECKTLRKEILPPILEVFDEQTKLNYLHIDQLDNFELLMLYEETYKNDTDDAIKLFIGNTCLSGFDNIIENTEKTIATSIANKQFTLTPDEIQNPADCAKQDTTKLVNNKFRAITFSIVASAGLADGINPCAFATLVFFISVLTMLKKSRREILLVGLTFAASVFLTYLLLGLGAFKLIQRFSVNSGVADTINMVMGILTLLLAAISFRDFFVIIKSGKNKDIQLKLPKKLRYYINRIINKKMHTRHILLWSAGLGVIISILESACTGQLYLPTISYILKEGSQFTKAFAYLTIYNIMFIVPLLLIFAIFSAGTSSKKITTFFSNHIAFAKFILGTVFTLLGVMLLV
ncbi:MAG: tetratricopeptide repeat protein [Verrucomicrobiota bacterium]|nr:tetratricopeptide repeat protein [Verrucomicrobiota bacterium]